ncbi:MAG: hypothetical protein JSV36_13400, partial [Anaerolineae bacterium]
MSHKAKWLTVVSLLAILSLVVAACATPTAEVIEKVVKETVVVEKEVTKVVEKEVEKEVAGQVFNIEVWAEANEVEHYRVTAPMLAG